MKNWKRIAATALSGCFVLALILTSVQAFAESVASEEEKSGAIVVVNDYCTKVADGQLPATDPLLLAGGTGPANRGSHPLPPKSRPA